MDALIRIAALSFVLLAACGGATQNRPRGNPPSDPVTTQSGQHLYDTGMALAAGGDLVRGEQYLAAAISRGYPEDRAMRPLVKVCVAASRLRQALGYAEPYLQRHPTDWRLRLLVGSILHGLGQESRAREELARVVRDAPEEADPHYQLATMLRDVDGDVAARPEYERYLALAPTGRHAEEVRGVLSVSPGATSDHGASPGTAGNVHTIERVQTPAPGGGH